MSECFSLRRALCSKPYDLCDWRFWDAVGLSGGMIYPVVGGFGTLRGCLVGCFIQSLGDLSRVWAL